MTLKKNVIVITTCEGVNLLHRQSETKKQVGAPSVRPSATRKSANGGIPKRAFRVAKAAERKTKGERILKS